MSVLVGGDAGQLALRLVVLIADAATVPLFRAIHRESARHREYRDTVQLRVSYGQSSGHPGVRPQALFCARL